VASIAAARVRDCDAAIVTSFCPDAIAASAFLLESKVRRVFYDLDAPVTLDRLRRGINVEYLPPQGLGDFDRVLSFTGGRALTALREALGARSVAPLYGSVDPDVHHRVDGDPRYAADLSYLGTYAQDRQQVLEQLFLEPARRLPGRRFRIGGSLYPEDFPWRDNVWYSAHVPPPEHPAFFASGRLTLNVTRGAMATMGWCPSGRLFEAAACGTPIVSDTWEGLDAFFEDGREILVAREAADVVRALSMDDEALGRIAAAARERVLDEHTGDVRAAQLVRLLEEV
jgi:spore maturation protein CgeB